METHQKDPQILRKEAKIILRKEDKAEGTT